ncbi:hypothetical protein AAGG74_17805 [Bacillus mexicanus]|uniref:hypothetical protein n=1 Tax=Bacillus mexicanus TaxID=2834415 RepID=UPI003D1AFEBC
MQYGLKRESIEKIIKGICKASNEIESLKQQKQENIELIENHVETQVEKAEMALTILSHTQEFLENFDFVVLSKEEFDYVCKYL